MTSKEYADKVNKNAVLAAKKYGFKIVSNVH